MYCAAPDFEIDVAIGLNLTKAFTDLPEFYSQGLMIKGKTVVFPLYLLLLYKVVAGSLLTGNFASIVTGVVVYLNLARFDHGRNCLLYTSPSPRDS